MTNNIELLLYSDTKPYSLDIDENTIFDITFVVSDIKDIATVKAGWSRTLALPDTKTNYLAFKSIADLEFDTNTYNETYFNINSKTKCQVLVDKVMVFNGYLQLVSIDYRPDGSNYYNCILYDATKKLADSISGLYLTDINLSALTHTYSLANVAATWDVNSSNGYYYPFIDYNNGWKYDSVDNTTNRLTTSDFKPALYVKYLWDMIFNAAGISYKSSFLNSTAFTNLIMPSVYKDIPTGPTAADDKKFKVSKGLTQSDTENNNDNGITIGPTLNGYPSGTTVYVNPNPGPGGGLTYSPIIGQVLDATINGLWKWNSGKWVGGYLWSLPTSQSPLSSINNNERRGTSIRFNDESTTIQSDNFDGNNMWNTSTYVFTNTSPTIASMRFVCNLDIFSPYSLNNAVYYTGQGTIQPDTIRIDVYRSINPNTGATDSNWNNGLGFQIPNGNGLNNWFEFYGDGSSNTPNGNINIISFDSAYKERLDYAGATNYKSDLARINFYTDYLDGRYDTLNRFTPLKYNEQVRVVIRWKTWHSGFLLPNVPGDPSSSSIVTNRIAILGGTISTNNLIWRNADDPTNFADSVPVKQFLSASISSNVATSRVIINNHGLSNGTKMFFSQLTGGAGLSIGTNYFVINATTNDFQLSLTAGGAAIAFTTAIAVATLQTREAIFKPSTCFYNEISTSTPPGALVNLKNILPDMKQTDFIDTLTKMFNLYYESDKDIPDLINIEPRNTYVNSGVIRDWTTRVGLNEAINRQLLAETQNKNTIFTYSDDNDYLNKRYKDKYAKTYGNYNYEITKNEYLKGTKEVKVLFSPSPMVKIRPYESDAAKNFIFTQIMSNSTTTSDSGGFKINPRILYKYNSNLFPLTGGLKIVIWDSVTNALSSYTSYPYAGTQDNPYEPTLTLDFGTPYEVYYQGKYLTDRNLVNVYWKDYLDEISGINSYIITLKMILTPIDIYNFKFSDIIYLNLSSLGIGSGAQYYRVNKISGYNPSELTPCEVELIKADKYTVTSISGNGGNGSIFNSPSGNNPQSVMMVTNFNGGSQNQTTLTSNSTNQIIGAASGLAVGSNNTLASSAVVNGNNNNISVNSPGAIVSGSNNTISANANNSMVLGNNNKVSGGVNNVLVFGDNIEANTSNAIISSNPIIEYFNIIDAGKDVVLDLFSDGSPINVIDAGYNSVIGLDRDSMINMIDAKQDEV